MKYKKAKIEVEYLEDKIVTDFETSFSYLVLEDFYEGGYEDITEDEFFYEEYFMKYHYRIVELLLELEDNIAEKFMELKIRLIKLKRIIDTKISNIGKNENDILQEIEKPKRTKNPNTQFLLNKNFDKDSLIKLLHKHLLNNELINIDLDEFSLHFTNAWECKILWKGTEKQIANLINLLIENKYLRPKCNQFKYKIICSHFINKNGNPFKEKQLSKVFSIEKDNMYKDITNEIFDNVSTNLTLT
ncbi:hypothetical protein [Tenacibaculum sp.]|uniref:hypothetical protein n=1 Tax=Tenacibaculum sp. TaxID=1906242 RepID=UPI003AA8FBB3